MKFVSAFYRLAIATGALSLVAFPATAHHSYSMFDRTKSDSYAAVVRTWEFTNPHATLWVYINDASGKPQLWGLEAPGTAILVRSGWNKYTVKPGDKVTVLINPLRDGRNGGHLIKLTAPDGRTVDAGAIPGGAGGSSALNNGPESAKGEAGAPKK